MEEIGTYVAVEFTKRTTLKLKNLSNRLNVPNPVDIDDFHTTIIYSRKKFDVEPNSDFDYGIWSNGVEIWKDGEKNILVLLLTSNDLQRRFEELIRDGGTTDFPSYQPHITLSSDVGDWQIPTKLWLGFQIKVCREYYEDLTIENN